MPKPSKFLRALIAATLIAPATLPAAAQEGGFDITHPEGVAEFLRDEGFRARFSVSDDGLPQIESSASGFGFRIDFYDCTYGRDCRALLLTSGFDLDNGYTLKGVNDWNEDRLIGRAFLDFECDPIIDYFVPLYSAWTGEQMLHLLDSWEETLTDYTDFVGFNEEEGDQVLTCDGDEAT